MLYDGIIITRFSNCWFHIAARLISFACQNTTFHDNFSTFFNHFLQSVLVSCNRIFVNQWANVHVLIQWISNFQLSISFYDGVFNRFVNLFMNDQSTRRSTSLSSGSYGTKNSAWYNHFQICSWRDYNRIISS